MAEGTPPFLRLAVGLLPAPAARDLASAVRLAIEQVTAAWQGR
jgi:hypothetical protein